MSGHIEDDGLGDYVEKLSAGKVDQLKVRGLCLLMALNADEEKSENQPVIAGNIDALMGIVKLIDDSEVGNELTVIFTPEGDTEEKWKDVLGAKKYGRDFGTFHKTTFTIRKTATGIEVDHIDSTPNYDFVDIPDMLILKALKDNADAKKREATSLLSRIPDYAINKSKQKLEEDYSSGRREVKVVPEWFHRQRDRFSCGVYAIKDAKYLKRGLFKPQIDPKVETQQTQFGVYNYQRYTVPPEIYRSTQDLDTMEHLQTTYGETVVNRKGLTMRGFLHKYMGKLLLNDGSERLTSNYVIEFGNRYLKKVKAFLKGENASQAESMIRRFDGARFTHEDLQRINDARRQQLAQKEPEHKPKAP